MLQGHRNLMDHVSLLDDVIQATAHTEQPLAYATKAMAHLHMIMSHLSTLAGSTGSHDLQQVLTGADTLAHFAYTAVSDTSDCPACFNAEAI